MLDDILFFASFRLQKYLRFYTLYNIVQPDVINPQPQPTPQPLITEPSVQTSPPPPNAKKPKSLVFVLISIILVLLAGFGAYVIERNRAIAVENDQLAEIARLNNELNGSNKKVKNVVFSSIISQTGNGTPTPPAPRLVLWPQTVAPSINECLAPIGVGADGTTGPLTCANGSSLNVAAWVYYAQNSSAINLMKLGQQTTSSQFTNLLCNNNPLSLPMTSEVGRLVSLYNGWSFGAQVLKTYNNYPMGGPC